MMAKVFILLLFFAKCQAEVFSNGSALYQLHTDLFKGYLSHVRPVKNVTTVTEVKVTLYVLAIEELDLRHQTLSQSIFMDLTWKDEFLSWDPQDYAGLSKIYIQQKHLWIPDLIFGPRAAEQSTKLGQDKMLLTVSNEGQVTWSPSLILRTACEVDVTVYPYDTQTCDWSLFPWVLTDDSVVLKPDPTTNGFSKKDFSKNVEWDLLRLETSLCDLEEEDEVYSCIKFGYTMRRRSMFLSLTVIVPTLLLAMLSALVFALPAESGEKVSLAMTLMLTFVFLLSFVMDVLPQSSLHISLLVTFLVFLCTCSALSLVLVIIVLSFYHRPDCVPLTPSAVRFVRCVRGWRECCRVGGKRSRVQPRVCPMKLKSTKEPALREGVDVPRNGDLRPEDSLPGMKGRNEKKKDGVLSADEHGDGAGSASPEMTWRDVAEACDYLFLRVFVIGIVIVCSAGCAYLLSDS